MLFWKMATRLPKVMVMILIATSMAHHSDEASAGPKTPARNTRKKTAKPAALEAGDRKPVKGVGEPSYTSGVQKW